MFPYYWGANANETLGFGLGLTNRGYFGNDLPEEVREALENRKDEIHDEQDIRDITDELMKRR